MRQAPPPIQYYPQERGMSTGKAILGVGMFAVVSYFGYNYASKMMAEKEKASAANAIADNGNAQVALALKGAIYNIGFTWLAASFDEVAVMNYADRITDLQEVRKFYKIYHNRDLDADLQAQAQPEELVEFMRRASKAKSTTEIEIATNSTSSGASSTNTAPKETQDSSIKGSYVVTKSSVSDVKVRIVPNQGGFFNDYNKKYTLPSNCIAGTATGKYVKDTENNVGFVEVVFKIDATTWNLVNPDIAEKAPKFHAYLVSLGSSRHSQQKVWLPKSMVDFVPTSDYFTVIKPNHAERGWFNPVTLSGIASPKLYIKRGHIATVYDENMQRKGVANDKFCLGVLLREKGNFYEFENTQGKTRWVQAQHVNLV